MLYLMCLQDYQFRVDHEWVVDGTRRGNVARLLNHSCNPNVRAAVLPSTTRIVLIAMRVRIGGRG